MKKKHVLICSVFLIIAVLVTGCNLLGGAVAKDGDTVYVHYTGTLSDGTIFDSSVNRDPLEFELGAGNMISGFENAVRGMKVGEKKTVTLSPDEAYGEYDYNLVMVYSKSELPEGMTVEVGQQLTMQSTSGSYMIVTVIDVAEDYITIDGNHWLAGEELTFEIELVEIDPAA